MISRWRMVTTAAQKRLQAARTRWKNFLLDQGFNVGDEMCLPDPPGKELKPLIPRGLTWQQHATVWREGWKLYLQSWSNNFGGRDASLKAQNPTADSADAGDLSAAARDLAGKYFRPQTKEGVKEAASELRDAVFGEGATMKDTEKRMKEKAKDLFEIFQQSTGAFVEGYREALEVHDKASPPPSQQASASREGGGAAGDDEEGRSSRHTVGHPGMRDRHAGAGTPAHVTASSRGSGDGGGEQAQDGGGADGADRYQIGAAEAEKSRKTSPQVGSEV